MPMVLLIVICGMALYKGNLNTYFRNSDGTFAYDQIYDMNEASDNGSMMAMSKSINEHNWYGLLSTYTTKFGDYIDFYGGIDFRYYKGTHTNELSDLYGGKYFLDESREKVKAVNNALAGTPEYVKKKLQVGDVVYRDYDGYAMSEGVFAQAEYNKDKLSAFLAGSISNTGYWRYDRFYYDKQHAESETVNFIGYTVKGGANYNLNEYHNVFANVGYISRAPFFSGGAFLQSATSNATNPDAVNEKIFSFELGYGFRSPYFTANLNVYHTQWFDKTNAASVNIEDEKGNQVIVPLSICRGSMPLTKELNWTLWQDLSDGWILTVCSLLEIGAGAARRKDIFTIHWDSLWLMKMENL